MTTVTTFTIGDQTNADSNLRGALFVIASALMGIGLVMVASTSTAPSRSLLQPGILVTPFGRQVLFVAAGICLIGVTRGVVRFAFSTPRRRRWFTYAFVLVTGAALVAAMIPGLARESRGSQRWLRFAISGFELGVQPSELAKLGLVLLVAWLVVDRVNDPRSLTRTMIPASVFIGLFVLLVGKEDFGTSVIIAGTGVMMLLVGGCRFVHLAVLGVLGAGGMAALIYLEPYRLARLAAFRDIWADPRGGGYQPIQSLTSIASGGWLGSGLGSGVQKYGFLPECHTDFIFAIICEEMGLIGGGLVVFLFCALVWIGFHILVSASTRFERLVVFGITATFGLQAAMNIAVVTVVTPTTGVSLPLVSSGGSGLLTCCMALGILLAISDRASIARSDRMMSEAPAASAELLAAASAERSTLFGPRRPVREVANFKRRNAPTPVGHGDDDSPFASST